jgi:hypothetical protein
MSHGRRYLAFAIYAQADFLYKSLSNKKLAMKNAAAKPNDRSRRRLQRTDASTMSAKPTTSPPVLSKIVPVLNEIVPWRPHAHRAPPY